MGSGRPLSGRGEFTSFVFDLATDSFRRNNP
jgi:hypothetical protein